MQVAVRLILEEGLRQRFRRHEVAASALRAGVQAMGLEMFPDASLWSNTVSCIKAPKDVEPPAVVTRMRDQYGILIGTGLDKLRTTTLRIGTMGITASPLYVMPTLSALELTLRDLGYKCEPGAGMAAAQARVRRRLAEPRAPRAGHPRPEPASRPPLQHKPSQSHPSPTTSPPSSRARPLTSGPSSSARCA